MGKHYWKEILPKVLALEEQGYTHQMVGDELGYSREQIKALIKRYHKNQQRRVSAPVQRGKPRTRSKTAQEELIARIKQLEMENELLRSFLQAAGRR